jgi:hypothetical protein
MTKEIRLFCSVFMTSMMKSIRILSMTNYVKIIDMTGLFDMFFHATFLYCLTFIRVVLSAVGDHSSTVVKVLRYKSEGCWFDPRWCHGIFH